MGQKFEVGGRGGELHEDGDLAELQFEGLQSGDTIKLETTSGSSYMLTVTPIDYPGKPKVSVERSNSRQGVAGDKETSWENVDAGTLFDLKGSCEHVLTSLDDQGLTHVGGTEGRFIVGERAWLTTETGGKERTLITSRIRKIGLIPAV